MAGRLRNVSRQASAAFAALLLALVLTGCGSTGPAPVYESYGPAPDGYYRIRRGDTLYSIARRHKVGYQLLARWNKLASPYRIYAGSLLRVQSPQSKGRKSPSSGAGSLAKTTEARGGREQAATATKEAKIAKETKTTKKTKNAKEKKTAKQPNTRSKASITASAGTSKRTGSSKTKAVSGLQWRWPLDGKVTQRFRSGDRTRQGIRISGRPGQKVLAAEGGLVVYSGSGLKGYGNLIIVKHNNSYLSAYGFNRRLLVSEGARVNRGQGVAEVGQASNGDYRLHFEIRKNGTAVDPLKYLP